MFWSQYLTGEQWLNVSLTLRYCMLQLLCEAAAASQTANLNIYILQKDQNQMSDNIQTPWFVSLQICDTEFPESRLCFLHRFTSNIPSNLKNKSRCLGLSERSALISTFFQTFNWPQTCREFSQLWLWTDLKDEEVSPSPLVVLSGLLPLHKLLPEVHSEYM